MANYTQHYQLHQWEPNDNFLRTDFNADFEKIDTALGGKIECVTGTYGGDGRDNRFLDLGRTPSAVILCDNNSIMVDSSYTYGGIALDGFPATGLTITEGGFTVRQNGNINCNYTGPYGSTTYYYIAFFI